MKKELKPIIEMSRSAFPAAKYWKYGVVTNDGISDILVAGTNISYHAQAIADISDIYRVVEFV